MAVSASEQQCQVCQGACALAYKRFHCDNPEAPHEVVICGDRCLQTFYQERRSFTSKVKRRVRQLPPAVQRRVIALGANNGFMCHCFAPIRLDPQIPTPARSSDATVPPRVESTNAVQPPFAVNEQFSDGDGILFWQRTPPPPEAPPPIPAHVDALHKFHDKMGRQLSDCEKLLAAALSGNTDAHRHFREFVDEKDVWELIDAAEMFSSAVKAKTDAFRRGELRINDAVPHDTPYFLLSHLLAEMPQEFAALARSAQAQQIQSVLADVVFYLTITKMHRMKDLVSRVDEGETRSINEVAREFQQFLKDGNLKIVDREMLVAIYFEWPQKSFDSPREIVAFLPEEGWKRFRDPASGEYWWSRGEEWFYERASTDWTRYAGEERYWWQHSSETRWFKESVLGA
eukprot:GEMP01025565.1.p1 GENE.GEMP01025565.1~~GEMP01025565.1.p1  ORF type:complete len:401 (+),score=94.84 GEMP01025565.1:142-1344(+)